MVSNIDYLEGSKTDIRIEGRDPRASHVLRVLRRKTAAQQTIHFTHMAHPPTPLATSRLMPRPHSSFSPRDIAYFTSNRDPPPTA